MTNKYIITSEPSPGVLLIQLNRPKALNALRFELIREVIDAIHEADENPEKFGAVVITGNDRAFAAGADIKQMKDLEPSKALHRTYSKIWTDLAQFGIPIIAAVEGFALGGGSELAMSCDIIYASNTALFGQPEIKLGIIPGGGATQRLIRAIGKSRAMEINLLGNPYSALDAEKWGLVSKTFEEGETLKEALKLASKLARGPRTAIKACKRAVKLADETPLSTGLELESGIFYTLFGRAEQKEGMAAFIEKRRANFDSKL